jgi:low temperature requirement protein LtrA
MVARSPHEAHRTATPLELFFDLVFVVAIAQAANGLHHAVADAHAIEGLVGYLMVFFAIWWAWMNFTWFASAYDCDDVPYRLAVFVQIAGALILAAGVAGMFATRGPDPAVVAGYVVMRLAAVTQWLRAAAADAPRRTTARRYAIGIAVLQVAWVATVFMPQLFGPAFVVLAALELAVPVWAEAAGVTTWHPHHITERYGLLTLIVLGESILAATLAVQSALASGERLIVLTPIIVGGLLIAFSMWWLYFGRPVHDLLTGLRKAIVWGYGHYLVFASAAAVGAGLAATVDQATHHAKVGAIGAGMAVAIPAAIYLVSLWFLHDRPEHRRARLLGPFAAVLVVLAPLSGRAAVPLIGLILAGVVAVKLMIRIPGKERVVPETVHH